MPEKHEHEYPVVAIQPVMGDDKGSYRQNHADARYNGPPMAILYYVCKCKHRQPFEYGKYQVMLRRLKEVVQTNGLQAAKFPALRQ